MQVPALLTALANKLDWSEKEVRISDGVVRWYLHNSTEWTIIRGAHGGITRIADRNKNKKASKKDADINKVEVENLKAEMKANIEKSLAE